MRADSPRGRGHWPRVGRFRYHALDGRWEWSDEVARMHGYEPGRVRPTTELLLAHKPPDDRPTVVELVERVQRYGAAVGNEVQLIDTSGDLHTVVVVGNPLYDKDGAPSDVAGFYVDVTEQVEADVQKRLTESVAAVNARRAVINQAMGVLMLRYALTADCAFRLLSRLSQETNTKLRVLAERVVMQTSAHGALRDDAVEWVDGLLRGARDRSSSG